MERWQGIRGSRGKRRERKRREGRNIEEEREREGRRSWRPVVVKGGWVSVRGRARGKYR